MMKKIFSFLIVVLFFTSIVHAATYYVATTGDNGDPGTEAQPWLTLTYGESQLLASDIVIVRGGTYNESFTINVANVTFQNYPSESPIIDGNWTLPGGEWAVLVTIEGNGVTFDGFEIQKSTGLGIDVIGADNVTIKNCDIHDTFRHVLRAKDNADNLLVEDTEIHDGVWRRWCYENPAQVGVHAACPGGLSYGTPWPANVGVTNGSDSATFRRCKVYDSYWEGLTIFKDVTAPTVEYCEIYGNDQMQLYFNCCKDGIARYNLIYGTTNGKGHGIWLNSEAYCYSASYEGNHDIYGNLVANTKRNFWVAGGAARPVKDITAYNNTFVEAVDYGMVIVSGGSGHIFKNNIVWQTNDVIAYVNSGVATCDYNLWSRTPDTDAQGANDPDYATPLLTKTSGWQAGSGLTGNDFTLQNTSPAIDVGVNLGVSYDDSLDPDSVWPSSVATLDQDLYGSGWEIGGFVYDMYITNASPGQGDTGVSITVDLSWTNPTGTTNIDLLFDKKSEHDPPTTVELNDQNVETWDCGTLDYSTEYAWRVDVNHSGGTETGTVYYFTTTSQSNPPLPSVGMNYCPGGVSGSYSSSGVEVR